MKGRRQKDYETESERHNQGLREEEEREGREEGGEGGTETHTERTD